MGDFCGSLSTSVRHKITFFFLNPHTRTYLLILEGRGEADWLPPACSPTRDQTSNLGRCPGRESDLRFATAVCCAVLRPAEPPRPGDLSRCVLLLSVCMNSFTLCKDQPACDYCKDPEHTLVFVGARSADQVSTSTSVEKPTVRRVEVVLCSEGSSGFLRWQLCLCFQQTLSLAPAFSQQGVGTIYQVCGVFILLPLK